MDDNRPDDPTPSPDSGRPRRAPPTIDLEASEVTTKPAEDDASHSSDAPRSAFLSSAAFRPFWVAGATGAVTAALVIAVAWTLGWPGEPSRPIENNVSNIEALASRVADLDARTSKPAGADPALVSRLDAQDKMIASLRNDVSSARAQSQKLAAELDAVKSASPESAAAPAPDLSAIEGRLSEIERAVRAESDNLAQATSKPVDDTALRRLVVASMLEISVRQGEPFTQALKAAKALAPDPQMLKPLENFASSGVPNPASLCRELLTLVPKLEPPPPQSATTGTGIVEHLKAGAAKLVRIERTDAVGNERGAIVARVTAAALRNDLPETRRELNSLDPTDRAPAQGWLDKAGERDAALAASRHFATEAMAALAKPAQ
ncbi:hypothetical protein [Bradyrhizobium sp.]|uniref:COG4223 family protein n=1 Tax=Bradyrhizobium sp. TaxID=376 RepID=UPI002D6295B9|nr:hypothetical protein [Bradyrhizobium sp.]HZR74856.1 hypothetical protein [Bradyrhizobium sp.]